MALSPTIANAQYFQKLYDIDSTDDWGENIFYNVDGSYFISGGAYDHAGHWQLFNLKVDTLAR